MRNECKFDQKDDAVRKYIQKNKRFKLNKLNKIRSLNKSLNK